MKTNKYLLGFDVGSSSVKASLVDTENGACVASTHYPENEAPILSLHRGWAEQSPDDWWEYLKLALRKVMSEANATGEQICAIGISYQMHGLVCVDRDMKPLRSQAIILPCDCLVNVIPPSVDFLKECCGISMKTGQQNF